MEAGKAFDTYEVIGIVTPGAVVAFFLALSWPEFRTLLGTEGFSLGDLGLFLVAAFVLGHLLQALGNLIELAAFPIGGLPSQWVRRPGQTLLTGEQRAALEAKVQAMEGSTTPLQAIERSPWGVITSRAYDRVRTAGRSARIDVCNRTYGMTRGLAAALLLGLGWSLTRHPLDKVLSVALAVLCLAAVWRMRRAAKHYSRTLFLAFIDLP